MITINDIPLCECGCKQQVKYDIENEKWFRFIEGHESSPLCKCECGRRTTFNIKKKRWNRFIRGHNSKFAKNEKIKELKKIIGFQAPLCLCGCKQEVIFNIKKKRWNRFIHGHSNIIFDCIGSKNNNWKGGISNKEKIIDFSKKHKISIKKTKLLFRSIVNTTINKSIEYTNKMKG